MNIATATATPESPDTVQALLEVKTVATCVVPWVIVGKDVLWKQSECV